MKSIDSLQPLLDNKNTVLGLDAYGVIYNNHSVFDHALSVSKYCESHAIPLYLMTNNATQSVVEISNKLHEFGIKIGPDQVVSSGCGCYMLPDIQSFMQGKKVYVYGYTGSVYYPREAGGHIVDNVSDSDCIVMAASLGDQNHYVYRDCYHHLLANEQVDVVCINPDYYVANQDGLMPVMGFYAHQMAVQLNRDWVWMGKPYSTFSDLVAHVLKRDGHCVTDLIFCDDNPLNVQQMIQDLGCRGCVITQTGVYSKYQLEYVVKDEYYLPFCSI